MDTREVLKKSELFSELDEKQLNIIYAMSTSQEVEPGVEVCKQGKSENYIYVIEDGLVSIILEVGPITHRQVQSASTLESFGWSAMIEPHISTATVKAKEKTKLLSFSGDQLYDLFGISSCWVLPLRNKSRKGYSLLNILSQACCLANGRSLKLGETENGSRCRKGYHLHDGGK